MPEIVDAVYDKEKIIVGANPNIDELLNDKASGLYFTFYASG